MTSRKRLHDKTPAANRFTLERRPGLARKRHVGMVQSQLFWVALGRRSWPQAGSPCHPPLTSVRRKSRLAGVRQPLVIDPHRCRMVVVVVDGQDLDQIIHTTRRAVPRRP
jgi:hypothetical protein